MWASAKMLLVFVGLGVPAGLVLVPWTLVTRNVRLLYGVGQRIAHWGLLAGGIRFDVSGREHIPEGRACLFLANHVSNLDPPALIPLLPGTPSVMLKRSLMRIPILGAAMRLARFVAVDREGSRESAMRSAKEAAALLASGISMLIFVEGTRSMTGRLLPFKRGPFHLAQATGVPIVPVVLFGTEAMLRRGSVAVRPGVVHLRFLEAVLPGEFAKREALMAAVRGAMVAVLPEEMRPEEAGAVKIVAN